MYLDLVAKLSKQGIALAEITGKPGAFKVKLKNTQKDQADVGELQFKTFQELAVELDKFLKERKVEEYHKFASSAYDAGDVNKGDSYVLAATNIQAAIERII